MIDRHQELMDQERATLAKHDVINPDEKVGWLLSTVAFLRIEIEQLENRLKEKRYFID